jgi:hypothetical protein
MCEFLTGKKFTNLKNSELYRSKLAAVWIAEFPSAMRVALLVI